MRSDVRTVCLGCLLVPVAFFAPAQAQTLPPELQQRPQVFDPDLDRERSRQLQEEDEERSRANRIEVPALNADQPDPELLPEGDQRFTLKSIRFNASSFLSDEWLQSVAGQYVGREIGFKDLNELLLEINREYRERKLLTARAIIPPQQIRNGELRVVLVEAKIDGVEWANKPERVNEQFYLSRLPELQTGSVLQTNRLLDALQRLNATTPGPMLSADLKAGDEFGTTRVLLDPVEPGRINAQLLANNYGSESSGEWQYGSVGEWNSPFGWGDSLSWAVIATEGTVYGDLEYRVPVNRYNGGIYAGYSRNNLEVINGPYTDLGIEGESQVWRLGFNQPWWLDAAWMLEGGLEYNSSESETTFEGTVPLSETEVDRIQASLAVQFRQAPWYVRYVQNVVFADTTNLITGDEGDYQTFKGNLYSQRSVGETVRLVIKSRWQYALEDQTLPSTLLFQLGGPSSVRGYVSGVVSAPHGIDASLETHWQFTPGWEASLLIDAGYADDENLLEDTLASAGLGLQYRWNKGLTVNTVYSAAMTDVVPDQDSGQLLLQTTWKF